MDKKRRGTRISSEEMLKDTLEIFDRLFNGATLEDVLEDLGHFCAFVERARAEGGEEELEDHNIKELTAYYVEENKEYLRDTCLDSGTLFTFYKQMN